MNTIRTRKIVGIGAVSAVFMVLVSPASAGRCGHSYAVDAPTTLATVARQCNVNLSALYEANPGVDPRNVRPGEYLAVPDEIDHVTILVADEPRQETNTVQAETAANQTHDDRALIISDAGEGGWGGYARWQGARGNFTGPALRVGFRDRQSSLSSSSAWQRDETGGARQHANADNLSYQQLSALRIHSAGLPATPTRFAGASASRNVKLIECQILRKRDGGKIHKVRKIISTPEKTFVEINAVTEGDGSDCRLISASAPVQLMPGVPAAHYNAPAVDTGYRLPDYTKIGDITAALESGLQQKIVLHGEIVDSTDGCLLLKTDNDVLRKLSILQPADDLLGKEVTIWGAPSVGGACGTGASSILISHAVYAERWPAR